LGLEWERIGTDAELYMLVCNKFIAANDISFCKIQ